VAVDNVVERVAVLEAQREEQMRDNTRCAEERAEMRESIKALSVKMTANTDALLLLAGERKAMTRIITVASGIAGGLIATVAHWFSSSGWGNKG
jgi:hypothetical protein